MGANAMVVLNDWFVSYPYASSFCVAALKASTSDLLAQTRERFTSEESPPPSLPSLAQPSEATFSLPEPRRVSDADAEGLGETVVVTCDEISCEDVAVPARPAIVWQRTLAFLLYGGLYQGVSQQFIFNEIFPLLFGVGTDWQTVTAKVLTDQFVLTPLVCLPVAYVFKAVAFRYGVNEGLRRYLADAQRDLLLKYWLIWGPVQCLTFSVVPAQWRIPFIACVSFVWTFILSSISSRDDAKRAATEAT